MKQPQTISEMASWLIVGMGKTAGATAAGAVDAALVVRPVAVADVTGTVIAAPADIARVSVGPRNRNTMNVIVPNAAAVPITIIPTGRDHRRSRSEPAPIATSTNAPAA